MEKLDFTASHLSTMTRQELCSFAQYYGYYIHVKNKSPIRWTYVIYNSYGRPILAHPYDFISFTNAQEMARTHVKEIVAEDKREDRQIKIKSILIDFAGFLATFGPLPISFGILFDLFNFSLLVSIFGSLYVLQCWLTFIFVLRHR